MMVGLDCAIETRDLHKTYPGGVPALAGLTFAVRAGEVFGLLGPNGAGKSTTVRVLATLSLPTSGQATVDGVDVVRRPQEVRQRIGYVAQASTVDPLATGRENLRLQGQLQRIRGAALAQRVSAALELFGLSDAADRPAQTYSGGMRRRLDVAMGLIHGPRILILDEPTTGLDPESRAVMWREIRRRAREERITLLVTTHYLEEADRLCDRVAIIDGGRVVACGAPEELKATLRGDLVAVELAAAPPESGAQILGGLDGVSQVVVEGATIYAQVAHGPRMIPTVVGALEAGGLAVAQVSCSRPSLDEVYLSLTGRSFDKADAAGNRA
jgi:ABC-2 type transport system ATP-binding protein